MWTVTTAWTTSSRWATMPRIRPRAVAPVVAAHDDAPGPDLHASITVESLVGGESGIRRAPGRSPAYAPTGLIRGRRPMRSGLRSRLALATLTVLAVTLTATACHGPGPVADQSPSNDN